MKDEYKRCPDCGHHKHRSEFGVLTSSKDGLYPYCRLCKRDYDIELRERHLAEAEEFRARLLSGGSHEQANL